MRSIRLLVARGVYWLVAPEIERRERRYIWTLSGPLDQVVKDANEEATR